MIRLTCPLVFEQPPSVLNEPLGGFELRPLRSYLLFAATRPYRHGSVDLSQWNAYSSELDGDLREWDERANKQDCWRDWWKTGRDWIEPETDE